MRAYRGFFKGFRVPVPSERLKWAASAWAAAIPVVLMTATALAGELSPGDNCTVEFMLRYRWPALEGFMLLVSWISSEYIIPVILLGLLALLWRQDRSTALRAVGIMASSTLWQIFLKAMVGRLRPEPVLYPIWEGAGFPSGHVLTALVITYLLWRLAPKLRLSTAVTVFLGWMVLFWPLLVGVSRLYLNAHFLSDVTTGYFLGIWHLGLAFWFLGSDWFKETTSHQLSR